MKEIRLSRGQVTKVDDEDFDFLNQWRWCAMNFPSKHIKKFYAVRQESRRQIIDGEIWVNTKAIRMHRVLMNPGEGLVVDHIDGDSLNNQKDNLRVCTYRQNQQNKSKSLKPGNSKYKGVTRGWGKGDKKGGKKLGTWTAQIRADGTTKRLGNFKTEKEAALAYNEAAKEYFGEYANLNKL